MRLSRATGALTKALNAPSASARLAAGPAVCVAVLAVTIAGGSKFWMYNITLVAIYAIVVVGLNLLTGYAGQVSFAQTAFMAVGGYGVAILGASHGWNPWAALVLSVVIAGMAAAIIGFPLFRLRGHYLTMATFALAIGVYAYANGATGFTGGAIGIAAIPPLAIGSLSFAQPIPMLLLAAGLCFAAMGLAVRLRGSHVGRAWRTLATREDVADSLGVPVRRYKLVAFVIAAVMAAISGALYVEYTAFASPDLYDPTIIVNLFVMLFVGGRGRTFGPLVGTAIVLVFPQLFSSLASVQGIVFDLLLLVIILLLPQGLLGAGRPARSAGTGGGAKVAGLVRARRRPPQAVTPETVSTGEAKHVS